MKSSRLNASRDIGLMGCNEWGRLTNARYVYTVILNSAALRRNGNCMTY